MEITMEASKTIARNEAGKYSMAWCVLKVSEGQESRQEVL